MRLSRTGVYAFRCKLNDLEVCQELHARGYQPGRRMHPLILGTEYMRRAKKFSGSFSIKQMFSSANYKPVRAEAWENMPRIPSEAGEI